MSPIVGRGGLHEWDTTDPASGPEGPPARRLAVSYLGGSRTGTPTVVRTTPTVLRAVPTVFSAMPASRRRLVLMARLSRTASVGWREPIDDGALLLSRRSATVWHGPAGPGTKHRRDRASLFMDSHSSLGQRTSSPAVDVTWCFLEGRSSTNSHSFASSTDDRPRCTPRANSHSFACAPTPRLSLSPCAVVRRAGGSGRAWRSRPSRPSPRPPAGCRAAARASHAPSPGVWPGAGSARGSR